MKLRIKSMIWNIGKKKTTRITGKKKNKKMRIGKGASGTTSNIRKFE